MLALTPSLFAQQEPAEDLWVEGFALAADAQLSGAVIHDIAFAKDHQVWLATSVGLVQFDGVHWTRWGKREGVPESAVTAIEFDSQGDLWIGTEHGLGSLRGSTFQPQLDLGLVNVRRLVADTRGNVWLCVERQPSRMDTIARCIDGQWQWVRTDPRATELVASGDRIFVVANQRLGEIVREGVEWLPDLPPFAPPGSRLTIAAEPASADKTQTGYVLVATQTATLSLIDGVWLQHHGHSAVQGGPVLRTSNGTFLGLSVDGQRLWRMKSSLLRPKSERLLSENVLCMDSPSTRPRPMGLWGRQHRSLSDPERQPRNRCLRSCTRRRQAYGAAMDSMCSASPTTGWWHSLKSPTCWRNPMPVTF